SWYDHVVALGDVADSGSDRLHDPGHLIARRTQIVRGIVLVEMAVPADQRPAFGSLADSRIGRANSDFLKTRLGDLHVPDLDSPRSGKHNRRRLHRHALRVAQPGLGTISASAVAIMRSPIWRKGQKLSPSLLRSWGDRASDDQFALEDAGARRPLPVFPQAPQQHLGGAPGHVRDRLADGRELRIDHA